MASRFILLVSILWLVSFSSLVFLSCFLKATCVLSSIPVEKEEKLSSHHLRSTVASNDSSLSIAQREPETTITGCVVLYGTANPIGITAWMKYNEERWGLNRVEFHIREAEFEPLTERLSTAIEHARETKVISQRIQANFHSIPYFHTDNDDYGLAQLLSINKCLHAAQLRGSDFFLQMDPDEFLVSQQFQTLPEMFAHYGNKPALVFPIFNVLYDYCSSFKPTFDSATYRYLVPAGAIRDTENPDRIHHDVPKGFNGNRKYIVRPDSFTFVKGVHEILFSGQEDKEDDLVVHINGRDIDGESTRIIHFRTNYGIQADEREFMCPWAPEVPVEKCKYMSFGQGCSPEAKDDLELVHDPTEVHRILAGVPLSEPAMRTYDQAVCYAERYPHLKDGFCKGDINNCNYKILVDHYESHGKQEGLTFNCTPTTE